MGSICASCSNDDKGETYMIRKMDTGSLNLENHNPLLDMLVVEKYKSGAKITAKARGFLFRKNFQKIKLAMLVDQSGKPKTRGRAVVVELLNCLPAEYIAPYQTIERRLRMSNDLLSRLLALYSEINPDDSNPNILAEAKFEQGRVYYFGQIHTKSLMRYGFGVRVVLDQKNSNTTENPEETGRLPKGEITSVDIGIFKEDIFVYGVRMFAPENYFLGEITTDSLFMQSSGVGEYFSRNYLNNQSTSEVISLRYKGVIEGGKFTSTGVLVLTQYNNTDDNINLNEVLFNKKFDNKDTTQVTEKNNVISDFKGNYSFRITYDGIFWNGKISGRGTVRMENVKGSKNYITSITGDFSEGMLHGNTAIVFPMGNTYKGQAESNAFHGKGVYNWNSIQSYNPVFEGEYQKNGKSKGRYSFKYDTVTTLNEGSEEPKIMIYQGSFSLNLPSGEAELYLNKVKLNNSEKKISHEVRTEKQDLIIRAEFVEGKLMRVLPSDVVKNDEFSNYEAVERAILGSLKKETLVDIQSLNYLRQNDFGVKS